IGRVTGKGLASNMRKHYPPWLLYGTVVLLITANVINIAADSRADQLDRRHQRIREQQRPQQFEAELRPRLRVCPDAGRIVVGGA
ncbi:hypothetical protein QM334_39470, partial [Burkholderia cenocepacia]|nr:hypothetical protein [Burkholderia cenocepacia]